MGVSGSGKSTVGRALAEKLGWSFFDADNFHPAANVAKMATGEALDDEDRGPWLVGLHTLMKTTLQANQSAVLACSALKQSYRATLRGNLNEVRFLYLEGSFELIKERLQERAGHFMKADLLKSQFDTLQESRDAIRISIDQDVNAIVETGITALAL